MTLNEDLIALLLSNNTVKNAFFKIIKGTLVFDSHKFTRFIESKEFLPDSYTTYTNKIGLTHDGNFLSKTNDVVLDFPYKDCVLEGGQDKDEQKRQEKFYHELIASDEINRMLAPKVFTAAKRYTAQGIEENITLRDDDNLIIKGNNLIALASLLKRYEGKVKCIYIDPPYNTGSDSFHYNDSFNHSTWLTFIKNRLELAKKLLQEDGVIFVSCDDNEQAYLKVLLDEIFRKENFVADFIRKTKSSTNDAKTGINIQHENCLCFAKDKSKINLLGGSKDLSRYKNPDNDPNGPWTSGDPSAKSGSEELNNYPIVNPYTGKVDFPPSGRYWIPTINTLQKHIDEGRICFKKEHGENERGFIYKRYLKDLQTVKRTFDTLFLASNEYMNQVATKEAIALDFVDEFKYPKPEAFIKIILEHSTEEGDLVLDFFLGSGTTPAVAHKMGRRYIGVEQMDYISEVTIPRLQKVIEGEQGGISKDLNWQGGGSFVYCELLEDANALIKQIDQADESNITEIKQLIYSDSRIVPYLTQEELNSADSEFAELTLADKKQALIRLINKNKLYVNYEDIADSTFAVNDSDKQFSKSFYEE
ncbi:DNA methyltransferase [Psittacicella melopsittaci]|uniref:DNA methyltransferase n=1 Tax=Psittacicella melopsittaci TaxID=2028576 RepID=UPI001CA66899|nr:site-specific DNA-methyltransferase [Psittacicella melopsittaci]